MKFNPFFKAILISILFLSAFISLSAQEKKRNFCNQNNWSSDNKVSFTELREISMPSQASISVDGKRNGGISVKGENRNDILIRACISAWAGSDEEAKDIVKGIRIEKGSSIYAEGSPSDSHWSVSYEVLAPEKINLKLTANNGGISISGVDGDIEFDTKNGGVSLSNLAGNVKGRTRNGGLNVSLSGNSWKGEGLDVETQNGGTSLSIPENYSAKIEAGTVNGGFNSEFTELQPPKKEGDDWGWRNKRISKDLNGGGPLVRVVTTNGGVKINKN